MQRGDPMFAEKFTKAEVWVLREQIQERVLDPSEIAEVVHDFLTCRGYGISLKAARDAVSKMGAAGCSLEAVHRELEEMALVM